jgi:hypothetical protein
MFETLMKVGGYRVDYLNPIVRGNRRAFAFYVRGELPAGEAYSVVAKRHLFAGLDYIQQELGQHNLVAIYLDVSPLRNIVRPAYQQLKVDMRSGMFRRVFAYRYSDFAGDPGVNEDLARLFEEVGGFDLVTCDLAQIDGEFLAPAMSQDELSA